MPSTSTLSFLVLVLLATVTSAAVPCVQSESAPAAPHVLEFAAAPTGDVARPWFVTVEGWRARLGDGGAAGTVELAPAGKSAGTGNLMCWLDAAPYAGARVRLSARLQAEGPAGARAQMWLRVDRDGDQLGALDNMGDRPVLPSRDADAWTEAVIELEVTDDAKSLALGFLALASAKVRVADVTICRLPRQILPAFETSRAPLTDRERDNLVAAAKLLAYVRFFHPSDEAAAVKAWGHVAARALVAAAPATDAADLARRLQAAFAPLAPTLVVWAGDEAPSLPPPPAEATQRLYWEHRGAGGLAPAGAGNVYRSRRRHAAVSTADVQAEHAACFVDKALGGGVVCRLPVRVYADDDGTLPRPLLAEPAANWRIAASLPRLEVRDRSTRLAAVALCWGVMQHFYPYFDVVTTDWDAALPEALQRAAVDPDARALLTTLRTLVAELHDGHGNVFQPELMPRTLLPLEFGFAGDDLVVMATRSTTVGAVRPGDVVVALDGTPAATYLDAMARTISAATDGWRRQVEARSLPASFVDRAVVTLRLRRPGGDEYEVDVHTVDASSLAPVAPRKPTSGTEVAPGIVYFDLDGAETAELDKLMPALAAAKGIVFDLRGYPGSAGHALLGHLTDEVIQSARWHVPIVTLPDREGWTFDETGRWTILPTAPRLRAEVAFLTGSGAISYAESVMGIVEHYRLGEIVGAPTAGTNGNVNPFDLPGGYRVAWTGMKVLKHDGSRHHGVGIQPTVPVEPTPQGIAAGRDEVLERALVVLQDKLDKAPGK